MKPDTTVEISERLLICRWVGVRFNPVRDRHFMLHFRVISVRYNIKFVRLLDETRLFHRLLSFCQEIYLALSLSISRETKSPREYCPASLRDTRQIATRQSCLTWLTHTFRNMKLLYFDNQFPNDDLQELYRGLSIRSKDRGHSLLARFIDDATSAIRQELRLLSSAQRAIFPPFENVFNLADHPQLRKGPLCGSVEGVLLCVLQLAILIGYVVIRQRFT